MCIRKNTPLLNSAITSIFVLHHISLSIYISEFTTCILRRTKAQSHKMAHSNGCFGMKTSVSKLFVFYEANKTEICRKPNDCQICVRNVRKVRLRIRVK